MKIFCLEDNALVVMHLEDIIEAENHQFAGSAASFAEAVRMWTEEGVDFDLALIDIDLTDGKTGIEAARWLAERACTSCFVTGQNHLAEEHRDLVFDVLSKPLEERTLAQTLRRAESAIASEPG